MDLSVNKYQNRYEEKKTRPLYKQFHVQVIFYTLLFSLAEYLSAVADSVAVGLVLHGLTLLVLLVQAAFSKRRTLQRFFVSMALVPMIRLMSLSMPLSDYQFMFWYMIIGAPLFLSAILASKNMGFHLDRMIFTKQRWGIQLGIGLTGIVLGFLEYKILSPQPLSQSFTFKDIILPALILLFFTGLLEEVIFRGLLQQTAREVMGPAGLFFSALLFAVMHIGYLSILDFAFVLGVALLFGFIVVRTKSLVGVTLAHGLTNISLFLVFPFLLNQNISPLETINPEPALIENMVLVTATQSVPMQIPHTAVTQTPTIKNSPSPTIIPSLSPTPFPTETEAVYQESYPFEPLSYIVDDGDDGFYRQGGTTWMEDGAINGDYVWAAPVGGEPDTVVDWVVPMTKCGVFEVFVYIPEKAASFHQALYQIKYQDGAKTITIDQAAFAGEWVSLGTYQFSPRTDAVLRLSNWARGDWSADELVVFDAAKWVYVDHCKY